MKQIELIGHSGCRVLLIVPDSGRVFVRKISKSIPYNERLKRQCYKQKSYKSNFAFVPELFREGMIDGLFYFDMQYISGEIMSLLIKSCPVNKINYLAGFLVNIIKENKENEVIDRSANVVIEDKIKTLFDDIGQYRNNRIIKIAFQMLFERKWLNLRKSTSHGDLTLENIIYDAHNDKFFLIDFLDSFYDSWINDISKILLDLLVGWSFRYDFIEMDAVSENTKIRVLLLSKQFVSEFSTLMDDKTIWQDIYYYILLNLIRVIPYITKEEIYVFVNRSIEAIINTIKKGDLYEHINTTMCWPIHKISGSTAEMDAYLS